MKGAIVLYLNLEPVQNGFPPCDEILSKILTEDFNILHKSYKAKCSAFFTAIFTLL